MCCTPWRSCHTTRLVSNSEKGVEDNTEIRNANNVILDNTGRDFSQAIAVPFSGVKVVGTGSKNPFQFVVEVINLNGAPSANSHIILDAKHLCRRLQNVDPGVFGLLRCKGLVETIDATEGLPAGPKIVYHIPAHANPLSPPTVLRSLLLDQRPACLSSVVKLAKQLVRSVSFVHTCDLVHKNICPDNILLFPTVLSSQRPLELGEAYLVGFSQFRSINSETGRFGDTAWHRNLYRHPARQGHGILDRYVMQHDIYSLGVRLLEIGLWQSFVWYPYTGDNTGQPGPAPSSSPPNPVPGLALQLRNRLSDRDFERAHLPGATSWIKDDLVLLAKQSLPRRMGQLYTEVVVDCLTCLDRGNDRFGSWDETGAKQDAAVVGVKFVERILGRIEEISVWKPRVCS